MTDWRVDDHDESSKGLDLNLDLHAGVLPFMSPRVSKDFQSPRYIPAPNAPQFVHSGPHFAASNSPQFIQPKPVSASEAPRYAQSHNYIVPPPPPQHHAPQYFQSIGPQYVAAPAPYQSLLPPELTSEPLYQPIERSRTPPPFHSDSEYLSTGMTDMISPLRSVHEGRKNPRKLKALTNLPKKIAKFSPYPAEIVPVVSHLPPPRENLPAGVFDWVAVDLLQTNIRNTPMVKGWQTSCTAEGSLFFVDHTTKSTSWVDPRVTDKTVMTTIRPYLQRREALKDGWETEFLPDGRKYYINHSKQKVSMTTTSEMQTNSQIILGCHEISETDIASASLGKMFTIQERLVLLHRAITTQLMTLRRRMEKEVSNIRIAESTPNHNQEYHMGAPSKRTSTSQLSDNLAFSPAEWLKLPNNFLK